MWAFVSACVCERTCRCVGVCVGGYVQGFECALCGSQDMKFVWDSETFLKGFVGITARPKGVCVREGVCDCMGVVCELISAGRTHTNNDTHLQLTHPPYTPTHSCTHNTHTLTHTHHYIPTHINTHTYPHPDTHALQQTPHTTTTTHTHPYAHPPNTHIHTNTHVLTH